LGNRPLQVQQPLGDMVRTNRPIGSAGKAKLCEPRWCWDEELRMTAGVVLCEMHVIRCQAASAVNEQIAFVSISVHCNNTTLNLTGRDNVADHA
jgi:hypothetical protein